MAHFPLAKQAWLIQARAVSVSLSQRWRIACRHYDIKEHNTAHTNSREIKAPFKSGRVQVPQLALLFTYNIYNIPIRWNAPNEGSLLEAGGASPFFLCDVRKLRRKQNGCCWPKYPVPPGREPAIKRKMESFIILQLFCFPYSKRAVHYARYGFENFASLCWTIKSDGMPCFFSYWLALTQRSAATLDENKSQ